jgi:hypothetical protein
MNDNAKSTNRSRIQSWLLAPLALAALAFAALFAHAAPSSAGTFVGVPGTYKIGTIASLAPGATYQSWWNNTPMGRSYFLDVRPGSSPNGPCALELIRSWRVRTVNGAGNPELELHYTLKNVGTVACGAEVWAGYVYMVPKF